MWSGKHSLGKEYLSKDLDNEKETVRQRSVWWASIPERRNSKCKGPEVRMNLVPKEKERGQGNWSVMNKEALGRRGSLRCCVSYLPLQLKRSNRVLSLTASEGQAFRQGMVERAHLCFWKSWTSNERLKGQRRNGLQFHSLTLSNCWGWCWLDA